jgi:hypothetical protein
LVRKMEMCLEVEMEIEKEIAEGRWREISRNVQ